MAFSAGTAEITASGPTSTLGMDYGPQTVGVTFPIGPGLHVFRVLHVSGAGAFVAPVVVNQAPTLTPLAAGSDCTAVGSTTQMGVLLAFQASGTASCALETIAPLFVSSPLLLNAITGCALSSVSTLHIPAPPLTLPTALDASNASAGTFAPQGTDVVLIPGGWVEWTVEAGPGGAYKFQSLVASLTGAVAQVSIDGVPGDIWNIPGQ